jgi:hypothetical protein
MYYVWVIGGVKVKKGKRENTWMGYDGILFHCHQVHPDHPRKLCMPFAHNDCYNNEQK